MAVWCVVSKQINQKQKGILYQKKKKIVQIYSKKHEALSARLKNRTILFKSCIKYFYK